MRLLQVFEIKIRKNRWLLHGDAWCKNTAFMFESVRLPKHPCPNQNHVHVREYVNIHAKTTILNNVHFREHRITRPSAIMFVLQVHPRTRKHCAQWDEVYILCGCPDAKTLRVVGQNACHIREHRQKRLTITALLRVLRPV